MSAEPPDGGSQECPRTLRLLPEGFLLPASTIAVLLRRGALRLRYEGWGLEPAVADGGEVQVDRATPRRGDLVLVNRHGWGDLLRIVGGSERAGWRATLDAYPARCCTLAAGSILGVATTIDGRPVRRRRDLLACRAGRGALHLAVRRVLAAPAWDGDASDTVLEKYHAQAPAYLEARQSNLTGDHLARLAAHVSPGGRVLVAGCGVGSEAIHLARAGYQVTGFDALPRMIDAARALGREQRVAADFAVGDLRRGDWPPGPYQAIYMTPLLYSFVRGAATRIACMRRFGGVIGAQGVVLFSVRLHATRRSWLETRLAFCAGGAPDAEPGDWYTRYRTPQGGIGTSFLRRFTVEEVIQEARRAGFGSIERHGSDFVAGGWRAG